MGWFIMLMVVFGFLFSGIWTPSQAIVPNNPSPTPVFAPPRSATPSATPGISLSPSPTPIPSLLDTSSLRFF